jgi:alpha-amylase/alpha-mannosidase (GH57 family)
MAALVAEHPGVRLTINLTPVLLWQIEDYVTGGATDRALELTLKASEALTADERQELLASFFDADWHNQIFPHSRYKELFLQCVAGRSFDLKAICDLQMWFNLAWFGKEFREGEVELATGERASVRRFVTQERDFSPADIRAMVAEQYKIMRAVIPVHRSLERRGQVEITTTPFYHPILPLLVDTDQATIDRPGAVHPRRFSHPEDAEAQTDLAIEFYREQFGKPPSGMWPAEGAVSQGVVPIFARRGVRWIATDRGVLARSGRWGYEVAKPDVLCQPYRAEKDEHDLAVFFRDTELSDAIGFRYYRYDDYQQAARDFLAETKDRFARKLSGSSDRVLTVVLDGENAWGAYRDDARCFLEALYGLLEQDMEITTVTFSEYLDGNPARGVAAHPVGELTKVYHLFTASWIDENGSLPGVDLGTWIGETEENQAWELLGQVRDVLEHEEAKPETRAEAFRALYAAEGSDWFWWFGDDQDSGSDDEFDDLFRAHLRNVYLALGLEPSPDLDRHIVPHIPVWTFAHRIDAVQPRDSITIWMNCPGALTWQIDDGNPQSADMARAGGVMAGACRYHLRIGPFPEKAHVVRFRFQCTHPGCDCRDACCRTEEYQVLIEMLPN